MRNLLVVIVALLCLPIGGFCGRLEPLRQVPEPVQNLGTKAKIELGKRLFFDRRLSGDGTMSCASCHDPEKGFSDGLEISLNYPTTRNWRNSPTLIGVGFRKQLFHDGRASTLEEQVLFPMMSAFEMNQNLDFVEEEIRSIPEYRAEFTEVFGDDDVTRERIAMAIAAFERTLIRQNAPLDRYLAGEKSALSAQAERGYLLFTGKGRCSNCHYGVNLADDGFHALQVRENQEHLQDPRIAATRRFVAKTYGFEGYRALSEDPGRYLISGDWKDWKAFSTPTLREIAVTAPYMHNGVYATLDEVIEFISAGGGEGNTVLQPLHLSVAEKVQLRAFLEEGLSGEPITFIYPKIP
jgi:cytochrome c peroxidase